jgi:putative SOS response-associated peptidase YedK
MLKDIEMQNVATQIPDWPAQYPTVYPKSEACVIVPDNGHLTAQTKRWGYEVSWSKDVVFNTRAESALKPGRNMWAEPLASRRCIVPVREFFEPHKSETVIGKSGKKIKQQYCFYVHDPKSLVVFMPAITSEMYRQLKGVIPYEFTGEAAHRMAYMFLAAIYTDDHFSIMTTAPNSTVEPIHDRMPVVLDQSELDIWLYGDYASLFDRSKTLLRAAKTLLPIMRGDTPLLLSI